MKKMKKELNKSALYHVAFYYGKNSFLLLLLWNLGTTNDGGIKSNGIFIWNHIEVIYICEKKPSWKNSESQNISR